MSLRPTQKNTQVCGIMLSAQDWARHAIGSDKVSGPEGFENFCSDEWCHFWHYKAIKKEHPEYSCPDALAEMSDLRVRLADDIMSQAKKLDVMIMRLQRMEEQMQEVIEQAELEKSK